MNGNTQTSFCPRCGALMYNGVCQSCGYRETYVQATERKKNKKGLVITLSIVAAVLLLAGLIWSWSYFARNVLRLANEMEQSFSDGIDDSFGDYYDEYDSGYYTPSEDDPYYEDIVDSTRTDLEYKILWVTDSVNPDDIENSCTYYATYPVLEGEEFDELNRLIQEKALQYKETYRDYPGGSSTLGYVTYMDEEKISIVFRHSLYQEDGTIPRLTSITFRLDTKEEMETEEMTAVNEELVLRFRSQDQTQNGGVEFVKNASDEELLALLQDPENSAYFYTPVGLEVGINYESEEYGSGWVSVTLKEQAL